MSQYLYPPYGSVNPESIGIQFVNQTTSEGQIKSAIEVFYRFNPYSGEYQFFVIKNYANELIEKEIFPTPDSITYFFGFLYESGQYFQFGNYSLEFYDFYYRGNATFYGYQHKFMAAVNSTLGYIWNASTDHPTIPNSAQEQVVQHDTGLFDESGDELAGKPAVEPATMPIDVPVDELAGQPAVEPVNAHADASVDELAGQPAVEPVNAPVDASVDELAGKPAVELAKRDFSKFLQIATKDIEIKIQNRGEITEKNTHLLGVLNSCLNGESKDSQLSKFLRDKNTLEKVLKLMTEVEAKIKEGADSTFKSIDFSPANDGTKSEIGRLK